MRYVFFICSMVWYKYHWRLYLTVFVLSRSMVQLHASYCTCHIISITIYENILTVAWKCNGSKEIDSSRRIVDCGTISVLWLWTPANWIWKETMNMKLNCLLSPLIWGHLHPYWVIRVVIKFLDSPHFRESKVIGQLASRLFLVSQVY